MKIKLIVTIFSAILLTATNLYAKPSECALSETCTLGKGKATVDILPTDGLSFTCKVTADNQGKITFNVKGGGKFDVIKGAGTYEAAPTIDVSIGGMWKTKPIKSVGSIVFNKVKGGTGTVICTAAPLT